MYRSLIRSKLDYGSIVYSSVRGSYLRMLDPIHNQALRLCLGAFRTYRLLACVYWLTNHSLYPQVEALNTVLFETFLLASKSCPCCRL